MYFLNIPAMDWNAQPVTAAQIRYALTGWSVVKGARYERAGRPAVHAIELNGEPDDAELVQLAVALNVSSIAFCSNIHDEYTCGVLGPLPEPFSSEYFILPSGATLTDHLSMLLSLAPTWMQARGERRTWHGPPANFQNLPRVREGMPSAQPTAWAAGSRYAKHDAWDSPLETGDEQS